MSTGAFQRASASRSARVYADDGDEAPTRYRRNGSGVALQLVLASILEGQSGAGSVKTTGGQAPASPGPAAVPATADPTATSWSSLPTMRNSSQPPWPSSPRASPSATCSPRSSSSSNRPCPCWPCLPPPEGGPGAERITVDPWTGLGRSTDCPVGPSGDTQKWSAWVLARDLGCRRLSG
jgi:hypothetical protein